ncbi:hypothetical protein F5Y00DRAFT_261499 [Daldinia vernicosa]|uniref:uncharacterized protein n=1 Tax=Daldinia vernicosa TaxID=114800 RepID=UPI002008ACFA|nr:uncharacterized protein F5Y00DRAFT_261499 [Daldinia vernicosa]KAI0849362.1 hypothetical protein F5Y00DRAFT_261499 [Daldinia vernicosa]
MVHLDISAYPITNNVHDSKKSKKPRRSSQDDDWSNMYMERHASDRSNAYVVYDHGEDSGSHSHHHGHSHGHSHSRHHGGDHRSHHRSHHGDSRGANDPIIPETIPEEQPVEEPPAPMNDQASFTDRSGYQTVVQPVSGGRAVRVSVGTGYTADGVAPQAGNYYPPSQNPFAGYNQPVDPNQAAAQDQANVYYTNQATGQDQANVYYNNQATGQDQVVDPETMAQGPEEEEYPEGCPSDLNGWGFGWSQPDPYGRQHLHHENHHHEKKHHKRHHHRRHYGKKSKSSKGDSWNGLYMERKKSDRGTVYIRRRDVDSDSSELRGRSPESSGRRESHRGSRGSSPSGSYYSSTIGSSDVSPQRSHHGTKHADQYGAQRRDPYGDQRGNQYGNQYGTQYANQHGNQHGSYMNPNIPPTRPAIPTQPVSFAPEPNYQQPPQAGYRVVEMPTPGGQPLRVSVATGYTSNGVAYQANGYTPSNGNQSTSQYQAASNSQAPGCTKDNPVNKYYRGNWF